MRDEQYGGPRIRLRAHGAPDLGLRVGVERARRLIESEDARRGRPQSVEGARERDALGLAAGESRAAHAEFALGRDVVRAGVREAPEHEGVVAALGSERDVVGDRSRDESGMLPGPRERAAGVGDLGAVEEDPTVVLREAEESASTLDLPAPLGPSTSTISPDRSVSSTGASSRSPRCTRSPRRSSTGAAVSAGRGVAAAGEAVAGAASAASSTAKISSVAATPSAAAWNCTPTWRSGR